MEYKHSSGRTEPQVDSHGASLFVYPIGIHGSLPVLDLEGCLARDGHIKSFHSKIFELKILD